MKREAMRRAFLMLFPGLAAGQVVSTTECRTPECGNALLVISKPKHKPANGECPVCGTMAPPYRWEPPRFCASSVWVDSEGKMRSACDPPGKAIELTRCAHCSNAFYQDAEVAK